MKSTAHANRFLLTLKSEEGAVQKKVWDGRKTLPLGHPFRWVVERTSDSGLRVRSLSGPIGSNYSGVHELESSDLHEPCEMKIGGATLVIHPIPALEPVYSPESVTGGDWTVYFCLQNCVVSTARLNGGYTARVQRKAVVNFKRSGMNLKVQAQVEGAELLAGSQTQLLTRNQAVEVQLTAGTQISIHWGGFYWFLKPVQTPKLVGGATQVIDEETRWFKKSLGASLAAIALLLAITWLVPKPDPAKEELIPPQLAKLIMTKPAHKENASASSASAEQKEKGEVQKKEVAKVKNTAVVQAFRAKALQNAVSGLLKGGMTKLLAQSEMLMGSDSSKAARRMLDGKAIAGIAAAPVTGLTGSKSVDVASMGGKGDGKSVGYGQGQRAGVAGQGKGFVGLDIDGASVEEGLSKDEVGRVIHAHMSEIRYCYESSMIRNADIEGKLLLDFVIGPQGLVVKTDIKESSLSDPRLDDCVIRRLTKWQFPKPKGGVNVAVSYPFIFKTLGR
jgi:TonB family protein